MVGNKEIAVEPSGNLHRAPRGASQVRTAIGDGSPDAPSPRRLARYAAELLGVGIAYFACAKAGLLLASINPSATPIWPATGLALAAVLLLGYRVAPAILLAAFLANATTTALSITSISIAFGNSLESVAGAWLIHRWSAGIRTFDTAGGVIRFALISLLCATPISASIGVSSLLLGGHADPGKIAPIWMTWWLGDAAGAVVIAPAIVLWALGRRHHALGQGWMSGSAAYVGAGAIGFILFGGLLKASGSAGPLGFLAILPLTWAALRRGPRDTATIALILSGFAVWGTVSGAGPFAQTSLNDSFLLLLTFMISMSVPSLALSADVAMRMEIEANLRRANEEMDRRVQERTAELVSTQQELHQAQKMEALGQLTGGVAHDFNNLLTAVLGSLELAMKRVSEARILRLLTTAQQAAERGAALTAQMLAFSRRQDAVRRPVDVNAIILEIEDLLHRTIGPLIRIVYNLEDKLWPAVADPAQLEMALLNLVVNSRDAMPLGGNLIVQTQRITQDEQRNVTGIPPGDYVVVSVADTGSGMPGDVVARAFDPFFTTKGPGQGTGLGLSMVYGFAKQTGGTARIESVLGEGTTVTLYLPRSFENPHSQQESRPAKLVPTATQRILVVDDDDDVRTLTMQMLEEMGHEVIDAVSGRAALDILKAGHACDLVLLDFAMPVMNGGECAAEAQRLRPDLPILFVTGYVNNDALKYISSLGCRVLRKPFQYAELAQAVHEASGLNSRTGKVVPITGGSAG